MLVHDPLYEGCQISHLNQYISVPLVLVREWGERSDGTLSTIMCGTAARKIFALPVLCLEILLHMLSFFLKDWSTWLSIIKLKTVEYRSRVREAKSICLSYGSAGNFCFASIRELWVESTATGLIFGGPAVDVRSSKAIEIYCPLACIRKELNREVQLAELTLYEIVSRLCTAYDRL